MSPDYTILCKHCFGYLFWSPKTTNFRTFTSLKNLINIKLNRLLKICIVFV